MPESVRNVGHGRRIEDRIAAAVDRQQVVAVGAAVGHADAGILAVVAAGGEGGALAEGRPHVDQAEVGRAGSDRAIGDNLAGEDHARGGVRLAGQALAAGSAQAHRADRAGAQRAAGRHRSADRAAAGRAEQAHAVAIGRVVDRELRVARSRQVAVARIAGGQRGNAAGRLPLDHPQTGNRRSGHRAVDDDVAREVDRGRRVRLAGQALAAGGAEGHRADGLRAQAAGRHRSADRAAAGRAEQAHAVAVGRVVDRELRVARSRQVAVARIAGGQCGNAAGRLALDHPQTGDRRSGHRAVDNHVAREVDRGRRVRLAG